ncbi:hypothetical protein Tco_0541692, partial [Tanacetum coccineum]
NKLCYCHSLSLALDPRTGHNNATFGLWLGTNIVTGPTELAAPIWFIPAAG